MAKSIKIKGWIVDTTQTSQKQRNYAFGKIMENLGGKR